MATAASLQGHFDEISAQAAVLPLAAAPKGFAQLDIASLADGPESASKVSNILIKAAAGLQECQICGCHCSAGQLGYLVTTQLDFAARSVRVAAGRFACEVCRALSSPALLLELSMPVPQSEDFTRAEQLREIFLHFAAVNAAPQRITSNPEALTLWVQELASRAYSMHVVASSLKGWQLHSPSGQLVQPGAAGAALQLLQELLKQSSSSGKVGKAAPGKHQQQQQQQQVLVPSVAKPAKRKSGEAALEAAAAAAAAGSSKKKAKKQAGTPAAAAAGKDRSVQQAALTHRQQVKTPKQKQRQHETPKQQQQQQQQQQQAGRTPKVQVKGPKVAAAAAALPVADGQQLLQAGGTSNLKKRLSSHPQAAGTANGQAAAATGTPGKKLKKTAAAAAAAVPFKTPQVAKVKKAKRRLSAE